MDTPQSLHRRAWDTIPWVVAGSASDSDQRLVEQHAATCVDCREELAFHRELLAGMRAGTDDDTLAAHDPEPALQRLMSRIELAEAANAGAPPIEPTQQAGAARQRQAWPRLLAAAVVVQAIGLAALAGMLWERPRAAAYETLSHAAAPSVATIRLVPSPELTLAQLQALLARSGLQIVESSGDGAILGLAPPPGATTTAGTTAADMLLRLRAEPGVRLAEPILDAAAARP